MNEEQESEQGTSEPELEAAVATFRTHVHAWSAEMLGRERRGDMQHGAAWWSMANRWRLTAATLALIVALSGATGSVVWHEQVVQRTRVETTAVEMRQQEAETARRNLQDEELLNEVDRGVAQGTPAAMEPLASLMEQ